MLPKNNLDNVNHDFPLELNETVENRIQNELCLTGDQGNTQIVIIESSSRFNNSNCDVEKMNEEDEIMEEVFERDEIFKQITEELERLKLLDYDEENIDDPFASDVDIERDREKEMAWVLPVKFMCSVFFMVTEEPEYESDFDTDSDIGDLEEENEEEVEVHVNNKNVNNNNVSEQNSSEEILSDNSSSSSMIEKNYENVESSSDESAIESDIDDGPQKYFGSSTDTNNDENIQRTFEVEVCIERQPRTYSDDIGEMHLHSKNETVSKTETNSIREETSADELTEDTTEDENFDEVDQQNVENESKMATNDHSNNKEENEGENISNLTSHSQNSLKKENTDNGESKQAQNVNSQESINSKGKLTSKSFTTLENTLSDEEDSKIELKSRNEEDVENFSLVKKSPKSQNGSFSVEISSQRPSSFNSEDYPFELSFRNNKRSLPDFQTRNLSFSNERMREIDRSNQILLKKILTQKSAYEARSLIGNKQKQTTLYKNNRQTSAAINRKKQQRQIEMDNQVLKRKLEAIAYRNPMH
ncbi:GATA zinc finger domain-containing protein 14 [Condylostylus longicornis]|uniref:GATA zinc finger domain-containing protein 14 n=1 Tax=Condylostylus longicornis TaxID=2530218 RepID=UPI00244E2D45|nr:GATA zinc finger domain-containing protein 14 [Condylostylus longicornis]